MPFKPWFAGHERFHSEPGSPLHQLYRGVEKDGLLELVEDGVENTDELINSYAESCDLAVLLSRYISGDDTALNRHQGLEGVDVTQIPTNLIDLHNQMSASKDMFEKLDPDIRKNFADFKDFCMSSSKPDFYDKLKKPDPDPVPLSSKDGVNNE